MQEANTCNPKEQAYCNTQHGKNTSHKHIRTHAYTHAHPRKRTNTYTLAKEVFELALTTTAKMTKMENSKVSCSFL